jgi:Asp-tRNA(Asn)/Glu-tRNA(Gln) amidotransferase A subunit family amidase
MRPIRIPGAPRSRICLVLRPRPARCDAETAALTARAAHAVAGTQGGGVNSRLGAFTNLVNRCDLMGFAMPAGLDANGRPVGVTLLGPAWSEGRLAAIADAVH